MVWYKIKNGLKQVSMVYVVKCDVMVSCEKMSWQTTGEW